MGMNNYIPTQNDIKIWMNMTDENGDGKISLEEYENIVIKSLEKAGFKIEDDGIHIA